MHLIQWVLDKTAPWTVQNEMLLNVAKSQHLHFEPNSPSTLLSPNSTSVAVHPPLVHCTMDLAILVDNLLSRSSLIDAARMIAFHRLPEGYHLILFSYCIPLWDVFSLNTICKPRHLPLSTSSLGWRRPRRWSLYVCLRCDISTNRSGWTVSISFHLCEWGCGETFQIHRWCMPVDPREFSSFTNRGSWGATPLLSQNQESTLSIVRISFLSGWWIPRSTSEVAMTTTTDCFKYRFAKVQAYFTILFLDYHCLFSSQSELLSLNLKIKATLIYK